VGGDLYVANAFGSWPAIGPDSGTGPDELHVVLPLGVGAGQPLTRGRWSVAPAAQRPSDVLSTYQGALLFTEEAENRPGLRRPQLGAVHSILGYWTTRRMQPATVVMPTGTGKTETMLALLVAARPEKLLVLVPSDALRDQLAVKFQRLGILQEKGIVSSSARRPVVGQIRHGFTSVTTALAFVDACNVIVATPQALKASSDDALEALLARCSHLFVDEAHHVAAARWSEVRAAFSEKPVVQFTATPFREDGKHLQGRIVYSFPLREAQRDGYFASIDYTSVVDFDDIDRAVAQQSLIRLRDDLSRGFDHVLMARVSSIARTSEVLSYYEELASDLGPVRMYSGMGKRGREAALRNLESRQSRIVICVNMLGEGYDLPALKVAAVHDPQKSLGVTLQFIGRFARTSTVGSFGTASTFVARKEVDVDPRLRELYSEDSDWNLILRHLTESTVEQQQVVSDFEAGFTSVPEEVTLQSLLPKMSTVAYRTSSSEWDPQAIVDFFGEEHLFTVPIGVNTEAGVAWCVVEKRQTVRWGDIKTVDDVAYELYVLYFDSERRLLYINHSANEGVFEDLAKAVAGIDVKRFTGSTVYRVMADIQRLVPTTVGVVDAHSQFRRFSMHVGSDVTASFSESEAGTKSQTNISGGGYRNGEHVNISASLKGRIWSHSTASSLKSWCDWCDAIGTQLLDDTISIEHVIGQFILPQAMEVRPEGVLLAAEWPWFVHTIGDDYLTLRFGSIAFPLTDVEIVPHTNNTNGPLRFSFATRAWSVRYEASLADQRLVYSCLDSAELEVVTSRSAVRLSAWLKDNGLSFILDGDRLIDGDLLYEANQARDAFARDKLTTLDWSATNIQIESQTEARIAASIQYASIALLKAEAVWDIILDDDGPGEIADIVAIRLADNELVVRLVHCKYSSAPSPGARVADLYEVCGQAQKSIIWRKTDMAPFFRTLATRAQKRRSRTGVTPFEAGDLRTLYTLSDRAKIASRRMEFVIVQPGLSAGRASRQQLELLASTESYLRNTVNGALNVWCSA
jgi:superfamily II DNA or RNA helicase